MDIPGYYYDDAKKKYFKIQANHVAVSGAEYSTEAVKRKRTEQASDLESRKMLERMSKERVTKSPLLLRPILRLGREVASSILTTAATKEHQASLYASQLKQKQLFRFSKISRGGNITDVIRIPGSGDLLASANVGTSSVLAICFSRPMDIEDSAEKCFQKWSYRPEREHLIFADDVRISSIAYSPAGCLLKTTDGELGSQLRIRHIIPDRGPNHTLDSWQPHSPIRLDNEIIWCSSACPSSDKAIFACGAQSSIFTLECGMSMSLSRPRDNYPKDIMALEWLSTSVIAGGSRDSSIFLHDYRSGGYASRLQHPSSVVKIRKVDDYRLLVSGRGMLNMYDLRFAKNGVQDNPLPLTKKHTSTRPYLEFPEYAKNSHDTNSFLLDFDVSPELGLVASVGRGNAPVLFSLQTANAIPSPISQSTSYAGIDPTKVKFESFEEGDFNAPKTPTLLAWSKQVVDQWSW
ncbi:hypothetical protein N7495_007593 [Penicillium taxi]|uniref:uncharacterized protein n=1 Tax=Penicillium taxi TaxID=168475 RepID=UPI002545301A|nr:uncharacterized protein N7495_007593 [Penicillium taxi]KAJ5887552.1 hypothetical protein N7495_007593 [Penicillium taxi]